MQNLRHTWVILDPDEQSVVRDGCWTASHYYYYLSSVQLSSRWYLRAQKRPYELSTASQKFPQRYLGNGSNVRLIDDGSLSSFQGRSSVASSFHASLLQATDGVMSLAKCP